MTIGSLGGFAEAEDTFDECGVIDGVGENQFLMSLFAVLLLA